MGRGVFRRLVWIFALAGCGGGTEILLATDGGTPVDGSAAEPPSNPGPGPTADAGADVIVDAGLDVIVDASDDVVADASVEGGPVDCDAVVAKYLADQGAPTTCKFPVSREVMCCIWYSKAHCKAVCPTSCDTGKGIGCTASDQAWFNAYYAEKAEAGPDAGQICPHVAQTTAWCVVP